MTHHEKINPGDVVAMKEACKRAVTELDCMYVNGERIPYGGIPADPESSVWREAIKAAEAAIDRLDIEAEAKSQEPEAVAVKPLEWREEPVPPSGECLASTPVGLYCIPLGRALFVLRFRDKAELGSFATLDAAKAAAQADYEQRIRSALIPTKQAPAKHVTHGERVEARQKERSAG